MNSFYEGIKTGLAQAIAHEKGDPKAKTTTLEMPSEQREQKTEKSLENAERIRRNFVKI